MDGVMGALLDSMVGYKIPKTVRVRDRTLAAYACLATICIALYIVGWKIGVEKAYLEYEPVVGYVKLDLVGHTPQINLREEEYCRDMKCRLCDAHDVRYPNTDTRQPLVTTYVREARQQRVCHRNATECPFASPFQTALWDDYLVAGVGHFQIKLWHAAQAPTFYQQSRDKRFSGDSRHMHGRLVGKDPGALGGIKTIKDFPPNGQRDQISIAEILEVCGFTLCVCVCVCVCVRAHTHTHTDSGMYTRTYVRTHVRAHTRARTHTHTHTRRRQASTWTTCSPGTFGRSARRAPLSTATSATLTTTLG